MNLPARATIATFVQLDATGSLALEDGTRLRFGRSACKGFEPVVGARVIVEEVARDPRGEKAKVVKLADADYDALLSARDAQHGLPDRQRAPEDAAAVARQLAAVTILLRDPMPAGHQALDQWARALGLPRDGFAVKLERDLSFVMPGRDVLTYVGRAPFPGCEGRGFLGLALGVPGFERQLRAIRAHLFDPWAPDGVMRNLSRLVCLLAGKAHGVVLHRARHRVVAIDEFVRALGDLDDPANRPFAAWIDVDGGQTYGMDVFGLPDVNAPTRDAALAACATMIRENREP